MTLCRKDGHTGTRKEEEDDKMAPRMRRKRNATRAGRRWIERATRRSWSRWNGWAVRSQEPPPWTGNGEKELGQAADSDRRTSGGLRAEKGSDRGVVGRKVSPRKLEGGESRCLPSLWKKQEEVSPPNRQHFLARTHRRLSGHSMERSAEPWGSGEEGAYPLPQSARAFPLWFTSLPGPSFLAAHGERKQTICALSRTGVSIWKHCYLDACTTFQDTTDLRLKHRSPSHTLSCSVRLSTAYALLKDALDVHISYLRLPRVWLFGPVRSTSNARKS